MDVRVVHHVTRQHQGIADLNRQLLQQSGVFTLNLIGAPGCGKTSLIGQTIVRLVEAMHIGVVSCDPATCRDADRLACYADQIVQVDTGEGCLLTAGHVREALEGFTLDRLDLLIIENVSSVIGPAECDLGEDAKAGMFSIAEGDDKADKYADLVTQSRVLILNKMDLLSSVPFNLAAFRADARRLNPSSPLFELSALSGDGLDPWLSWLGEHVAVKPQ